VKTIHTEENLGYDLWGPNSKDHQV